MDRQMILILGKKRKRNATVGRWAEVCSRSSAQRYMDTDAGRRDLKRIVADAKRVRKELARAAAVDLKVLCEPMTGGITLGVVEEFFKNNPPEEIDRLLAEAKASATDEARAFWDGPSEEYVSGDE